MSAKKSHKARAKSKRAPSMPAEPYRGSWWVALYPGPAVIVGLFLFYWAAFWWLGTFAPTEQRIVGVDPVGYYAWIHSLAFDSDLDFANEYRSLNGGPIPGDTLVNPDGPRTATGHLQNAFSLGPGLLWAPFILMAHVVAALSGAATDGFSQPYQSAVFFANIFYALAGTLLTYLALRTWFSEGISTLAAVAAWAASPLLYYTYAQEAMSHASSYFAIALLLVLWARLRERPGYLPWLLIGAALGLATLVRWQNVTFALIPTVDLLARDWRQNLPRLAACGAATVLIFLPQMLAWKVLYGSFLTIPQGSGFMEWTHPHPLRLLFSPQYGLVTWTPLCATGLVGLFVWPRDNRLPFVALAIAFLVQFYVQSAAGNVGWTFGMRRMDNCMPILAVGMALLMARLNWRIRWAAAVVAVFGLWNLLFVLQYGGFLNRYYVGQAFNEFAAAHHANPQTLLSTRRLPDGRPFDPVAFAQDHVFPKGGSPSFRQFVPDKALVLRQIARQAVGKDKGQE